MIMSHKSSVGYDDLKVTHGEGTASPYSRGTRSAATALWAPTGASARAAVVAPVMSVAPHSHTRQR